MKPNVSTAVLEQIFGTSVVEQKKIEAGDNDLVLLTMTNPADGVERPMALETKSKIVDFLVNLEKIHMTVGTKTYVITEVQL